MGRPGLVALIAGMALAGCGSARHGVVVQREAEVRASTPVAHKFVAPVDAVALRDGSSAFAGRLLGLVAGMQPGVAFSPLSISDALAMTIPGARGRTARQIAAALDFRLPPARLGAAFGALDQSLGSANGPGVSLSVANALYGQQGTAFRSAFLRLLASDYGAGIRVVDFVHAKEAARATINGWVSERTHGKITSLLGARDIDVMTRLVLVNAVYLHAKWESPFDAHATSPAVFHAPGGGVRVPTMHQSGSFGYARGQGYQALELPYSGGRLAFDVLLPNSGRMRTLLRRLGHRPLDLLRGLHQSPVDVSLPKLTLRTHFELADALKALGIRLAFDPVRADLSGIAGRPGDLYIGAAVHEAYLHVDEAGTEAAAATGVVLEAMSATALPSIRFDVNRPFVFLLRDRRTGAILFLGTVSHP